MIDEDKHINSIITKQDREQIKQRLDPIVDAWMERFTLPNRTARDRECIYLLAENCYLIGLLIDAQMIIIAEENEVKK